MVRQPPDAVSSLARCELKTSPGVVLLTTRVLAGLARVKLKLEPFLCPAMISLIAGCQFAYSQSLDEINKREEAVVEAWEKTPLTLRRAIFVATEVLRVLYAALFFAI